MESSEFAVVCENLEFGYSPNVKVLDGTSLSLTKGSFGIVFGKSGSGKSTLLRCLTGYLHPQKGIVKWPEMPVAGLIGQLPTHDTVTVASKLISLWQQLDRERHFTRTGLRRSILYAAPSHSVMMFADCSNALPHLTAEQNLDLVLAPICADQGLRSQAKSLLLEITDLRNVSNQTPGQLSSGELRRLCLAQSLAAAPQVLIWDEPTSGLDTATKYELVSFIQSLRHTVPLPGLMVTHDIETALLLADEIYLFAEGKILRSLNVQIARPRHPQDLDRAEYRPLRHEMIRFLELGRPSEKTERSSDLERTEVLAI